MAEISVEERLKQEETLKTIIRNSVDTICVTEHETYPNICAFCARSDSDKNTVVNDIFDLVTSESLPCSLLGAISQMESKLDGWGE